MREFTRLAIRVPGPFILLACLTLSGSVASSLPPSAIAATITIVNADGAGEGFNDPTPVSPVGGNPGLTRGEQRVNVFNHAASIWGSILPSAVTIQVRAEFDAQFCDASSAVLGSAGPRSVHDNFPGAEFADTWYSQALANKLSGTDQDPLEDIEATFNSDVDNGTCLGGVDWYYGLDGLEGNDIELLPVVLHELGHGLGFLTLVNGAGQLLAGSPDIYTRFMFDKTFGLSWAAMTDTERLLSRGNNGNLVWNGYATTFQAPYVLDLRTEIIVPPPAFAPGTYLAPEAYFGPALTTAGVTAAVVEVFDGMGGPDACQPILNGAALSGKIAYIDRGGGCSFSFKVAAAQAAGAVGVIMVNDVTGAPFRMPGSNPSITIPSVMISKDEGDLLREDVNAELVTATLRRNSTVRAGTHADGEVLLYAPAALEPGSSLSHFDVSATPDLVMEPFINDGLSSGVDLTRHVFEDMGWLPRVTAVLTPETSPRFRVRSAPNPFRPSTVISVELPRAGATRVDVYDLQGRLVKRLVNGWLPAGRHAVTWDGTAAQGQRAAAGVYFTRITSGEFRAGQRLVKLEN